MCACQSEFSDSHSFLLWMLCFYSGVTSPENWYGLFPPWRISNISVYIIMSQEPPPPLGLYLARDILRYYLPRVGHRVVNISNKYASHILICVEICSDLHNNTVKNWDQGLRSVVLGRWLWFFEKPLMHRCNYSTANKQAEITQ